MSKRDKVPNTISDKQMAKLRERGQRAEPFNLTDRRQIARRIATRDQFKQRRWS